MNPFVIGEPMELMEASVWQVESPTAKSWIVLSGILICRLEGKVLSPDSFVLLLGLECKNNCFIVIGEGSSVCELQVSLMRF